MKMSKREQRRHQNSSKRAADTYSIDPDTAMGRSQSPKKSSTSQDEESKGANNKWEEIYGATTGRVNALLSKQADYIEGKQSKKKNKGGKNQKGGGGGNKRFRLGNVI